MKSKETQANYMGTSRTNHQQREQPDSTVDVVMSRNFARMMLDLLSAVANFLASLPIALQGASPTNPNPQETHVQGLRLIRSAIQAALNEPLPETILTLGLQGVTNPENKITIKISGDVAFLNDTLPPLVHSIAQFGRVTNANDVIAEMHDAKAAVDSGHGYDGQVVQIRRRDK